MTDLRELVQDLRAHAHEAPAVASALMRRAARELERRALPNCSLCRDSGQMVVGETRSGGALVTSCTCRRENVDAER